MLEKKLTLQILSVIRNQFLYEKNHKVEYESTITLMFKRFDLNIKKTSINRFCLSL